MYNINVINYHVTNICNFCCIYCFGKFNGMNALPLETAKQIADAIKRYFDSEGIQNGRINLAGGEPLLYPYLDQLIDYIYSLGIQVSIVTNGFLLTPERIALWKNKVFCVGLSIDSLHPELNQEIGRCCKKEFLTTSRLLELADSLHQNHILLKINTVVSKLNLAENLSAFYRAMKPDKIKLLKMHLVAGINDRAEKLAITEEEFRAYCAQYQNISLPIVIEGEKSMENSYLMINPCGEVQINQNGHYQVYGNCIQTPLNKIVSSIPFDQKKFESRYGQTEAENE